MKEKRLHKRLYIIALICAVIASITTSCAPGTEDSTENIDYGPPTFGECVTYIENENGSVRLTDTVGFAFEFEVVLKRDFDGLDFEIPVYSDYDNRLVTLSTSKSGDLKPKIYVNGQQSDSLPTAKGSYKVRLDISHKTTLGYTAGNSLTAKSFGKIDLICLY